MRPKTIWRRAWDWACEWAAWHLPRGVAYHAAIRVFAHATTGKWGDTEVPALKALEAIDRWTQ